ncbi:MAG TPA: hypothetical protein VFA68_02190 [Terriglobales bacterium]|nr:hypothetical protein [Terriglobales bacterium]
MHRSIVWKTDQGWTCSGCDWGYPISIAVTDSAVRRAYDNLALSEFGKHRCPEKIATQPTPTRRNEFLEKMRVLVMRGLKPAAAVEQVLREASVDHRDNPGMLEKARAEGDEFLRRVEEGYL